MKYDLKRKMSYFKVSLQEDMTSMDLFNEVQKWIYMIELYHLNLRSNIADFQSSDEEEPQEDQPSPEDLMLEESITGTFSKKREYTVREMLEHKFLESEKK